MNAAIDKYKFVKSFWKKFLAISNKFNKSKLNDTTFLQAYTSQNVFLNVVPKDLLNNVHGSFRFRANIN